ncbi:MbtH family protein [Streptomyces sp. NPDC050485]|uniref:MbtH family protein n=1 Tax=Streptomyces sp. NPDC050485 TaxID=3365617 RepID=UPI00379F11DD
MTNPFDEAADAAEGAERCFVVLRNDEHQFSLWPAHLDVPAGWAVVYAAADRQSCLDHIERRWTDMRPRGLAEATP